MAKPCRSSVWMLVKKKRYTGLIQSNRDIAPNPRGEVHLGFEVELDANHQAGVFEVAVLVGCAFEKAACICELHDQNTCSAVVYLGRHVLTSRLSQIVRSRRARERGEGTGAGLSTTPGLAVVRVGRGAG